MTFLFEWMSLLFMGFVYIISSLVIPYSDNYTLYGDLNILFLFIMFNNTIRLKIIITTTTNHRNRNRQTQRTFTNRKKKIKNKQHKPIIIKIT